MNRITHHVAKSMWTPVFFTVDFPIDGIKYIYLCILDDSVLVTLCSQEGEGSFLFDCSAPLRSLCMFGHVVYK